jgi:hypothetical protein
MQDQFQRVFVLKPENRKLFKKKSAQVYLWYALLGIDTGGSRQVHLEIYGADEMPHSYFVSLAKATPSLDIKHETRISFA